MCTAMTAVVTGAVFQAVLAGTTVIGRVAGHLHLDGIMQNTDLTHVRGPGKVGEQNEEHEYFNNGSTHKCEGYPV